MTKEEVIKIATLMGLKHNPDRNFESNEEKGYIVFDGVNGQRFAIDCSDMSDDEIYSRLGDYCMLMGRRQLKMELHTLLNITSDN